jgi:CubicO group peptidase (beta-lactamase class C family)
LAALFLVARHRLELGVSVASVLKDFAAPPFTQITLDMLLDHTSGLPADAPLYEALHGADRHLPPSGRLVGSRQAAKSMRQALAAVPLAAEPGKTVLYSQLGFILLGWALEEVVGKPLDMFLEQEVYGPLGLAEELLFLPVGAPQHRKMPPVVATASCPWRGRVMHAEVFDSNAWALGGVAGNAGLFGSGQAVWRLAQCLLDCFRGENTFFHTGTVMRFWTRSRRAQTTHTLGWDTPTVLDSAAGKRLSRTAVGQVSNTGPILWIDPSYDTVGVFVNNGVGEATTKAQVHKVGARVFELIAANASLGPPPPDVGEAWQRLIATARKK